MSAGTAPPRRVVFAQDYRPARAGQTECSVLRYISSVPKTTKPPTKAFIDRHTTTVTLLDGTRMLLRPIMPDDKQKLAEGFERLSEESRFRRFMGYMDKLHTPLLRYLTEIDYVDHFAWVGMDLDAAGQPGIGVARYVRLKEDPSAAEAAVAVADDYQGRGAGTILLQALGATALSNGITRFVGEALADNQPVHELLAYLGARVESSESGEVEFSIDLPQQESEMKGTAIYRTLRAAARGDIRNLIMRRLQERRDG
jgi:GNAT superfamily N-acetyltransferase